jgi:hypothetical protein
MYKERKRGAYIMNYARRQLMMDISEDEREETRIRGENRG